MNIVTAALVMLALAAQQSVTTLDKAARTAELFWDQFTAVQCVEKVTQSKMSVDGKVLGSKSSEFDYVSVLKAKASGVAVEESRVPRGETPKDQETSFLLTSGFPALLLMFHPDLSGKFDFTDSPDPALPADTVRVAFKSRPEMQSMSALRLKGRMYPILWQGFAWLDRDTGNVKRIEAHLAAPMDDLGLSELRAEVDYAAVPLKDTQTRYQLPAQVTVFVRTPKQQWRNVHEFRDYHLFTVTSSTRGAPPKDEQ